MPPFMERKIHMHHHVKDYLMKKTAESKDDKYVRFMLIQNTMKKFRFFYIMYENNSMANTVNDTPELQKGAQQVKNTISGNDETMFQFT